MTAINNTETIAGRLPEFLNMSFSPGLLLEARKESWEIIAQLAFQLLRFLGPVFNDCDADNYARS